MAGALMLGAVVGDGVSKLSGALIDVIKQTWYFKSKLKEIQGILTKYQMTFVKIEKLTDELDTTKQGKETFITQIRYGENIVRKCGGVRWNIYKIYTNSRKLDKFKASFLTFCQTDAQILIVEDLKHLRKDMKYLLESVDVQNRKKEEDQVQMIAMQKRKENDEVPFENSIFKDQLRDLKTMVLKDPIVVVSAAGGCGKTVLVKMLLDDHHMKAEFGRIYYATISQTPNLKIVIKHLLQQSHPSQQHDFINDEVAIKTWRRIVGSRRILLILDDVWSDSIVKLFRFRSRGIKIVVTSRTTFQQFSTYHLELLNHQDAIDLFCYFALPDHNSENADVPDALVEEIVTRCNGHPLTLRGIAVCLVGQNMGSWTSMLRRLSDVPK